MKDETQIRIYKWMRDDLDLKTGSLLVYAVIYHYSSDGDNRFKCGKSSLISHTGLSRASIVRKLNQLKSKGLIDERLEYVNDVLMKTYKVTSL